MITQLEIIQIITGFIASFFFAILFNIRGKKLIFASLGGFISWTMFVLFKFLAEGDAIRYFLVALLIAVYAEIMARVLKTPTTTFVMTALIPLIPGGSLYYTMSAVLAGDMTKFYEKGVYTLQLAAALALGIIIAAAVTKMVTNTITSIKLKKLREHKE